MAEEGGSLNKVIIDKLTHENYETWSFKMMMLLVGRDSWATVQGQEICAENANDVVKQKFLRRQQKALALIGLHVGDEYLPHILNATDPKSLWDELKKFHKEESHALRI